ncbi:hypothetical protein NEOLEDRAFT_1148855 [Neolentinus lepideus HHB14362 ss-1]|uniref:NAD(P)-binding protein n=1 Tax=Neolentinus lepideus HHB14362 ss-1 TaxID=1314782 RepID=A0A165RTT3_9AGAM|nr:hypothetical protein NEOLEDRAFT_1148855 [Neolentinus lepideus HHB14362 ss-1]
MALLPGDINITHRQDVYPGIDINGRLKDAAKGKVVYIAGVGKSRDWCSHCSCICTSGLHLFLTSTSQSAVELKAVAESIRMDVPGVGIEAYTVDVTDEEAVKASCVDIFGRISVVIANAGYLENWTQVGDIECVKVFSVNPGAILTALSSGEPWLIPRLKDKVELASHSMIRLTSGTEDWFVQWDLDELETKRKEIELDGIG